MLFISPQNLISFSRYLSFLSRLFGHVKKRLDQKDKVNFKIYDVTTWLTNNCYIFSNISRCKGNQTMKFGQLIKCNMRNIFLEKSYAKLETSPRPFSKKFKLTISLDQWSKVL